MSDKKPEVQQPAPEVTEAAEAPKPAKKGRASEGRAMSSEKRTALLRYMAVLFAVAFALVLLSYLIQVRNSQSTITALNQTSASALQNAEALQQANQALSEEKIQLSEALSEALDALEQAEAQASEQAITASETQKALEQSRTAFDLLLDAVAARDSADRASYDQAMTDLTPIKDSLTEDGLELYKSLLDSVFPTTEAEPEDAES